MGKGSPRIVARREKVILVAGGAGFVGSHLCKKFLGQGHKVTCVDNFLTGDISNVRALLDDPNFQLLRHDICDPLKWPGPIDEIYNMACAASPSRYQSDPIHTAKTCFQGTLNLLDLAEEKNARILQSSTSEVYGDPEVSLQSEDYLGNVNICGPRACYDEGKRISETLMWEYGTHRGVETRIARIFNTYGPYMHPEDGRVVSNFVVQALQGDDITIYGTGQQTRSFCFISDLVEGLTRLMASGEKMPVNLGNPVEFTMLELAEQVIAKTGSRGSKLAYQPLPQDDPQQRRPDITRAKMILDWAPRVSLSDGLDMTVSWYRDRLIADRDAAAIAGQ